MFYAVRIGVKPGVYLSWDECAANVIGHKGSVYKKMPTRESADAFVNPLKKLQASTVASASPPISSSSSSFSAVKSVAPSSSASASRERGGSMGSAILKAVQTSAAARAQLLRGLGSSERSSDGAIMSSSAPQIKSELFRIPVPAHKYAQPSHYIYTDGSCLSNNNVKINKCPAGWGVIVVCAASMTIECELFAPVPLSKTSSPYYLGAEVGSNNTAELSAIGEALRWLISFGDAHTHRRVCMRYDSEYAANSVQGIWNGAKNKDLITNIRHMYRSCSERHAIVWEWVKGHSSEEFNDKVDKLARRGALGEFCTTGHYARQERKANINDEGIDVDIDIKKEKGKKRKREMPETTAYDPKIEAAAQAVAATATGVLLMEHMERGQQRTKKETIEIFDSDDSKDKDDGNNLDKYGDPDYIDSYQDEDIYGLGYDSDIGDS